MQDHDVGWHQHSEWSGHAFLEVWECHVGSAHRLQSKQFWSNHILDPSGMRSHERVYYHDAAIDTVEEDPLSLFGSLEIAPDGSIVKEAIGSRLHQIDAALHNELEHHGLMYDIKEHIWNKSNNSNAI